MRSIKTIFYSFMILSIILFVNGLILIANAGPGPEPHVNEQVELDPHQGQLELLQPVDTRLVNFLLIGLDEDETRADVISVACFNPQNKKLNILSITRDTKVEVEGKDVKINALMGMGGERLIAEKVYDLTGLHVSYYMTLNFKGFRKVIDTLDGVVMNVPFNMRYDDPEQNLHIRLKKGKQRLNGEKAEQLLRYRKGNRNGQGYADGDIGRIKMQQEFMKAFIDQKLKLKYLSKADDIFFILKRYVRTNVEIGDINYYIKIMKDIKYNDIQTYLLPGDSGYIDKIWYFLPDREGTRQLINNNFYD